MNPPEYVDQEKSIVEKYLFTPGKLSSLTNYFAKDPTVARQDEKIFNSIESGDVITLKRTLDSGGNPDTVFVVDTLLKSRWSALHQSCQKGHYDCAKLLIERGACMEIPDGLGQTPLYYCVCCEWLEIIELLIKSGCNLEAYDNKRMTPLHRSISCTTPDPLKLLLKLGAIPDSRDLRNRTPLWIAASQDGKIEFIQVLLKHGALVNVIDGPEQCTPMQAAVMHADSDKNKYINLLLEHGASVQAHNNSAPSAIQTVILRGRTSGTAVSDEDMNLLDVFIKKGCNLDHITESQGWHFTRGTALKMAADRGCLPIVNKLLSEGANPDLTDLETQVTPLLIATKKGHTDIVKELLLVNASLYTAGLLKLQTRTGIRRMNAFLCSLLKGYPQIARMIIKSGYNLNMEKYLWTNEDVPEYLQLDIELWLLLQEMISQPIKLIETVKRYLRKYLGYSIKQKLEHVTLPAMLKNYLVTLDLEE